MALNEAYRSCHLFQSFFQFGQEHDGDFCHTVSRLKEQSDKTQIKGISFTRYWAKPFGTLVSG
jgi:hypothetical protein